jgi:hypothetical protein
MMKKTAIHAFYTGPLFALTLALHLFWGCDDGSALNQEPTNDAMLEREDLFEEGLDVAAAETSAAYPPRPTDSQ